jgi:hypothetical protein
MEDVQIILSGLWVATMLTYLLGDVFRIMSGDVEASTRQITQRMWLGMAAMMVIPILMVVLTLTVANPANQWANVIAAVFFLGLNLIGLPTYPSAYDRFLLIVSMGFNVLVVWYAWSW